jgi:hypothetical protein
MGRLNILFLQQAILIGPSQKNKNIKYKNFGGSTKHKSILSRWKCRLCLLWSYIGEKRQLWAKHMEQKCDAIENILGNTLGTLRTL